MLADWCALASAAERAFASMFNTDRRALNVLRNMFSKVPVGVQQLRRLFDLVRRVTSAVRKASSEVRKVLSDIRSAVARLRTCAVKMRRHSEESDANGGRRTESASTEC
jgi:hypothetical protein